jgi:hypothetical protein
MYGFHQAQLLSNMAIGIFTLRQQLRGLLSKNWSSTASTASTYAATLNGTNQYVSAASNAALAVGTVFTIECWIYPTSNTNGDIISSTAASGFEVGYQSTTSWGIAAASIAWRLTSSTMPSVNTWNHIAIVRTGTGTNQSAIYLNGVNVATGTIADAWTTTGGVNIGASGTGNTYFAGSMSNVRIVKGVAVYTGNFIPPKAPLATTQEASANISAITGTATSLLTFQNATIIDNSSNAITITNTNSVTTSVQTNVFSFVGALKTPYVEYLVVGGGGGGKTYGGGGGAGGVLTGIAPVTTGTTYTVTVGGGGTGSATASVAGGTGVDSIISTVAIIAKGGGGAATPLGGTGGSGGGGGDLSGNQGNGPGGQGIFGQGNAGGSCLEVTHTTAGYFGGGGGGGAGTVGLNGTLLRAGNGGAGISSAISGTVTPYGGGGGGCGYSAGGPVVAGSGGVGGGGAGSDTTAATAGQANTGGGGGGGAPGASGGAGGSGIVIVSYPDIYAPLTTGGATSPTVSTSGSGSLLFNGTSSNFTYTTPASGFSNNGTTDFTLEFWVYITSAISGNYYLVDGGAGNQYGAISINAGIALIYNGTNYVSATTASSIPVINTWAHLAIVRSGSTVTTYLNGSSVGSTTNSYTSFANSVLMRFGSYNGASNWFPGYMSNFRYVNGSAIVPPVGGPTAPLTSVTNTKLLLSTISGAQFQDSSPSGLSPTSSTTTAAWNQLSPFATGLGYKNRVYTWAPTVSAGSSATGTFTV